MFLRELELLLLELGLTIQDRALSLKAVQQRTSKGKYMKMLIQQKLMLGARLSDLLWAM